MIEHLKGNILDMRVDVIVNPSNPALAPGGGLCGQIHSKYPNNFILVKQAHPLGLHPGESSIPIHTDSNPIKWIIHTVGPKTPNWEQLCSSYNSAARFAFSVGRSVAFPLISTGSYGVEKELSRAAANYALLPWQNKSRHKILIVEFDA